MTLSPPLKWAGGKRWLVPKLRTLLEGLNGRLVEPFCGGLSVTLGLNPERALLNDVNPHLINFYRWLTVGLTLPFQPSDNDEQIYYTHRERFNHLIQSGQIDTMEAAGLFYYLNRTGYNGLSRFNSKGLYNVPFGTYKTINYMTTAEAAVYRAVLEQWTFTSGDFSELALLPDDILYLDPPYDVEFTQYSGDKFLWADQIRLVEWLKDKPNPIVISNQATPRIQELYQDHGYALEVIAAPRRINSTGDRTPAAEVIATRNLTHTPMMQKRLF